MSEPAAVCGTKRLVSSSTRKPGWRCEILRWSSCWANKPWISLWSESAAVGWSYRSYGWKPFIRSAASNNIWNPLWPREDLYSESFHTRQWCRIFSTSVSRGRNGFSTSADQPAAIRRPKGAQTIKEWTPPADEDHMIRLEAAGWTSLVSYFPYGADNEWCIFSLQAVML